MKSNPLGRTGLRWMVLVLVACCGMSMGVLSNCDPAVADQILTGVGSATASVASTLITAAFQQLQPAVHTPVTTTST